MRVPAAIKRLPGGRCPRGPKRRGLSRPGPVTFARVIGVWRGRALARAAAIVVALGLVAGARAAAQARSAVGAQVGYSRADLTGEDSELVESQQGAIAGVYFHLPLTAATSVRPEFLFSLKGGTTISRIRGGEDLALVDIELAYLELPLLARLTLPRGRFRPVLFGGPSVGIQIGCDQQIFTPVDTIDRTCGDSVTVVSEWDYGWVAGAAIEMHLPRTTLALQGRYSAGLRSVAEGPVELKNRGIAILLGLTF
jgi:Outer membrane protein beta-barrel domain